MIIGPRLTGLKGKLNVQAIISNNKHTLKAHLICKESVSIKTHIVGVYVYRLCLTNRGK